MIRTTSIMWAIAVLCIGLAVWKSPPASSSASFEDTGELLVENFDDPTAATRLEVVSWDDKQAKVVRFVVERKGGAWQIPSHHGYPADGTERMAKAAAAFIDVKRDIYYGDKVENHAKYGVVDPAQGEGGADDKARRFILHVGDTTKLGSKRSRSLSIQSVNLVDVSKVRREPYTRFWPNGRT